MTRRQALAALGAGAIALTGCRTGDDDPADTSPAASRPATRPRPNATPAPDGTPAPTAAPTAVGVWEDITPPPPASFDFVEFVNYGAQMVAVAPSDPSIVYLGSCLQGIFRTADAGDTWTKVNTGRGGEQLDGGRNWTLAIDPRDADTLFSVAGYGPQGLWRSGDGGRSWSQVIPQDLLDQVVYGGSVSHVHLDPADPDHLLVGFHDAFVDDVSSLAESRDAGTTWQRVPAPDASWGGGVFPFFLASTTWLVATEFDGVWRTADAGATWEQTSATGIWHGSTQLYRAGTGTLYLGAIGTLLRSDDDGRSWTGVGPDGGGGFHAVIGDGATLYVQRSWSGRPESYYTSAEADGEHWTVFGDGAQTFVDGPMSMAFDPASRTLYSSNWSGGVWRLRV